jgi:hypothetical protein
MFARIIATGSSHLTTHFIEFRAVYDKQNDWTFLFLE